VIVATSWCGCVLKFLGKGGRGLGDCPPHPLGVLRFHEGSFSMIKAELCHNQMLGHLEKHYEAVVPLDLDV